VTVDKSKIESIIDEYEAEQGWLISILQDIQAEYRYLPQEALEYVAKRLKIPRVQVFGVATFFRAFSLKPRGRHQIHVCMGTTCHVRGSKKVLEALERKLGIKAGDTTLDSEYTLETVNCLGACALGPVVVKNEEYHGQMNPLKVGRLLKSK
jgi:NADH-quinone oxidoreductase subunit E